MSDADSPRNQPPEEGDAPSASLWEAVMERVREATAPRFEVERLLGYGGMAGVYLAHEPKLERKVAIKVMSPSLMMDPGLVERFRQEARTIAQLDHPNIITIYDVTEDEDLHYFVMAYVPGRTVAHVMKELDGPLPLDVVRAWMYQIGSALDHAHGFGVVHRDVKPGNVLLDGRGNALVTDFGIAKVADREGLTRTGMLVGTPAYMSPEQCSSSEVGPASDQYSLGALAYQMLTGATPFSGPTMAVLQAHLSQPPEPVRAIRPDCPPELAEVVDRMLAKSPGERWASLGNALTAMGAAPVGHDAPVRGSLRDLAAPVGKVTASSPRGVQRAPVPSDPVAPGETFVVEAVVTGTDGRALAGRRVSWRSDAPEVARALPDGRVVALAAGTARVVAECGGVTDALVFRVGEGAAGTPVAAPHREVPAGSRVRLAEVLPAGAPLSVGPDSGWDTTDPGVARITSDGELEALRPGRATVTAFHEGRAVVADLTVTPAAAAPGNAPGTRATTPVPLSATTASAAALPVSDPSAGVAAAAASTSGATGAQPTDAPTPAPAASPKQRRPVALLGAGALAVVLVGAGLVLFRGGDPDPAGPGGEAPPPDPPAAGAETEPSAEPPPAASTGDPLESGAGEGADVPPPTAGASEGTEGAAEEPPSDAPPPEDPPEDESPVQADPDPEPAAPAPPADGAVRVAGLPADARVLVIVEGAEIALNPGTPFALPPGSYDVSVAAEGYETYEGRFTIDAADTLVWRPALRAEPEPPDPGPDEAELRAEALAGIRTLVESFAAAFETRDMDRILEYFLGDPGAWAAQWEPLVEDTRNARDLRASMRDLGGLELGEGGRASVEFSVELEYRDFRNSLQTPVLTFEAVVEQEEAGWRFRELAEGS